MNTATEPTPAPKPVVHFTRMIFAPVVGVSAIVVPLDHPSPYVNNGGHCVTSMVVDIRDNGMEFETLNTIYRVAPEEG